MQKLLGRLKRSADAGSGNLNARTMAGRKKISEDTVDRSQDIIKEHVEEGASDSSTFYGDQLEECAMRSDGVKFPPSAVEVVNADAFTLARKIVFENPEAKGNVCVLNLASDQFPGGGWLWTLCTTQEEALCYSSTLAVTLKKEYYPWPNVGPDSIAGVYSPGVVIFKDDLDNNCEDLVPAERQVVSVVTVAAPRHCTLTADRLNFKNPSHLEDLKGKIRLVYRMAAQHGKTYLILGAMGCGAYACPPRLVAEHMKGILLEPEFNGVFARVAFAVYDKPGGPAHPPSNFDIFSEVFKDTNINAL